MFSRSCLALVLALAALLAPQAIPQTPAKAQPTIPDTPGRPHLQSLAGSLQKRRPRAPGRLPPQVRSQQSLDNEMQFRGMTGGFDLLQIVKTEPLISNSSSRGGATRQPLLES